MDWNGMDDSTTINMESPSWTYACFVLHCMAASSTASCLCHVAGGRVVCVNAELHMLATEATADFTYTGKDGQPAYQR